MKKFLLSLNLQLFADEGAASGVEGASAAGEHSQVTGGSDQTGVDNQAAAEPGQNNFEKAFAKRLAAEREKWDAEHKTAMEQYKDHDTYRKAAEYLQRTSGIDNLLTLKEEIELVELQERADKEQVSPEVQRRLEQLEAKAAKADEYEANTQAEKQAQEFETSLKTFCADKEIDGKALDHNELWAYMHENEVANPNIAYKAMKADLLEAKLATANKDAVANYLKTKTGIKTEGAPGAAAQSIPQTGGGFKGAEARAIARIQASRNAE
ncbi:hypothetical protein [Paenibacillus gorillae]|uniref:hypothetical protein n=1 Tax=Paenibacillus gorillae TaxID=1243662 RepID=UPI0004B35440|nr:hypothetical protein [Paenibacillus gorillae]